MAKVLWSLGANLGDPRATLMAAVKALKTQTVAFDIKVSSLYRTKPVGYAAQPDFLNICLSLNTSMEPYALLAIAHDIEKAHHRVRSLKNGPRTLDIDIVAYDSIILEDERLVLPHPRMQERAFVLIPLDEIEPDFMIKKYNATVHELRMALPKTECSGVVKID